MTAPDAGRGLGERLAAVEPGCTCGGMAACRQCQSRDAEQAAGEVRLTEAERAALWEAIESAHLDTTTYSRDSEDEIERAVERILTARVAAAKADALREARDALNVDSVGFRPGWHSGSPEDLAVLDALGKVLTWLDDRADRLAATQEPT